MDGNGFKMFGIDFAICKIEYWDYHHVSVVFFGIGSDGDVRIKCQFCGKM